MAHLEESLIRRFATLQATREENRIVVRHLLAGCEPCAAEVRAAFVPEVSLEDYELALERAAVVLAAWKRRALAPIVPFRQPRKTRPPAA